MLSCTVFEILSLIFQKVKTSRDSDHAAFRDNLSSIGRGLALININTKFKVFNLSRSRDTLGRLKNLKQVTWRDHAHFMDGLSSVGWNSNLLCSLFNPHTKFEVSTITCSEEIKNNVKCKNSRFELPFGGLRNNVQDSLWLNGKHIVDFSLAMIELFSLALMAVALLCKIWQKQRHLKGWVTLRPNFR